MLVLKNAVGAKAHNPDRYEVSLVQRLLNKQRPPHLPPIATTGLVGAETIAAIEEFQRRVVKMAKPDGRVDPGHGTLRALCAGAIADLEAYRVRAGDTVAAIARTRGSQCSAADVERANGLVGRYDLVVGQCLAVPKPGGVPVLPPAPAAAPDTPTGQIEQAAKTPGHPYVYFPTSPKPLSDLSRYIGQGVEHKFDERTILKGSIPGLSGNVVEWEVTFAGVIRVGRGGTVGTMWQTTDDVVKYRADLLRFGREQVVRFYNGIDLGVKRVSKDGPKGYKLEASLVLGSQFGNVSLEGKVTVDPTGGYTFTASRKVDSQRVRLPDGTELTVRGDFQVKMRLGRDMLWVLATCATWKLVKTTALGWLQNAADDLAQIDWEKTATAGVLSVAAAGLVVYKWARFVLTAKTFVEGATAVLRTAAGAATGMLVIILPQTYWETQSRLPGQPPSGVI